MKIRKKQQKQQKQKCFNNGSGNWDSRNGANYKVYKGVYGIKNGNINRLKNIIELYYDNPDWSIAYIHYKIGNGSWTDIPGIKMERSNERSGYGWKYVIDLGNEETAEVCFNNGSGKWDSKSMENYIIYAGIYGIKNKKIYELE